MTTTIITQIEDTDKELRALLGKFTQEQLNAVPFEGSWTAGQVADHIYKFQSGGERVMHGAVKPAERSADEEAAKIKGIFLDMSAKYQSPDFVLPSAEEQNKEELLARLNSKDKEIRETMGKLNLEALCLDSRLPGMGEMTRLEWGCFILYHTQRHIRQLEDIYEKLTSR